MRTYYQISKLYIFLAIIFLCGVNTAQAIVADQLYWTEWGFMAQNRICHSNLDGSNLTVIASGSGGNVGQQPYYFGPEGIAVDVAHGYVYWADVNGNKITRSTLDGNNKTTLLVATDPSALALDLPHNKIYWSDTDQDKIYRANLDGTGIQPIITTGLLNVDGMTIDSAGGKLYFTDIHTDTIKRANLDGTNLEILISGHGFQASDGIALDLKHGKIYWADWATYKIQRANLDGTGVEDYLTGLGHPSSLVIDPSQESLYYLDWEWNTISRVRLSDRHVTPIIGSIGVSSLSYIAYAAVPEPSVVILLLSSIIPIVGGYLWKKRPCH
jgi:sugar lactone lactonase YvrE